MTFLTVFSAGDGASTSLSNWLAAILNQAWLQIQKRSPKYYSACRTVAHVAETRPVTGPATLQSIRKLLYLLKIRRYAARLPCQLVAVMAT